MLYLYIEYNFKLELGKYLDCLIVVYMIYGSFNVVVDNVVWICYVFIGNVNFLEWWFGLVGEGEIIDLIKYFIICVNMLGFCYGIIGLVYYCLGSID